MIPKNMLTLNCSLIFKMATKKIKKEKEFKAKTSYYVYVLLAGYRGRFFKKMAYTSYQGIMNFDYIPTRTDVYEAASKAANKASGRPRSERPRLARTSDR